MIFNIEKYPYDNKIKIQKKNQIEIKENSIIYICGCNGYGKSTLLYSIEDSLQRINAEDIEQVICNPLYSLLKTKGKKIKENKDDIYYIKHDVHSAFYSNENQMLFGKLRDVSLSNGEGLSNRAVDCLLVFKKWTSLISDPTGKKVFFFLDDLDSGTSIDMINEIKGIFKLLIDDCIKLGITYYILVPINSFEFVNDESSYCIDACTFKELKFKTYNSYKKYVLKTRKIKDKNYGKNI